MFQSKRIASDDYYKSQGQYKNWMTLLDMCNAMRYGYTKYRLPEIGKKIDIKAAERRMETIEREWQRELDTRTQKVYRTVPRFTRLSDANKMYLHCALPKSGWTEYDDAVYDLYRGVFPLQNENNR